MIKVKIDEKVIKNIINQLRDLRNMLDKVMKENYEFCNTLKELETIIKKERN